MSYKKILGEIEQAKERNADIVFIPCVLSQELIKKIAGKGYDIDIYLDSNGNDDYQYTVINLQQKGERPKVTIKYATNS